MRNRIIFISLIVIFTMLHSVQASENITVEIISNISLLDDAAEGIPGAPLPPSRTYLFEGEQVYFIVLVTVISGIENLEDVFVTVNNDIQANCVLVETIDNISQTFDCLLTTETSESMHGLGEVKVQAITIYGEEAEDYVGQWFFNPYTDSRIIGELENLEAQPGERYYSDLITIRSYVEPGSNVVLDMYISGTDFYDSSNSGSSCPNMNQFSLGNLAYYAENGNYTTRGDPRADENGFVNINYGIGFNDPLPFWGSHEIIQVPGIDWNEGEDCGEHSVCPTSYPENRLRVGENLTLIFRLDVPLPCTGHFDVGNIYIWSSAQEGWGAGGGGDINFDFEAIQSVNVNITSNISYFDANGNSFNPPVIEYTNETSATYLREGEQIIFEVEVHTPNGAQRIDNVYITSGSAPGAGNNREVNCLPQTTPGDFDLNATYRCVFTVENANEIYGLNHIGVEAELSSGINNYSYLGLYSFNNVACFSDLDCDDGNSYTYDICVSPGTFQSFCSYEVIECNNNLDCDDSNSQTFDICFNAGMPESYCKYRKSDILYT